MTSGLLTSYITGCCLLCRGVKFCTFRKQSNAGTVVENQFRFYSLIFLSFSVFSLQSTVKMGWKMELRVFHMGLLSETSSNFESLWPKLKLKLLHGNELKNWLPDPAVFTTALLEYQQARHKVEKFTHLSLEPNWSWRSGDVCVPLLVYCLYGSNKSGECVCVQAAEQFSSRVLLPFSHFKTCYFYFLWYPQNKFKCLLSSSNQTAGDILEKKWNKMLCD